MAKFKKPELRWASSEVAAWFKGQGRVAESPGAVTGVAELASMVKMLCDRIDSSLTNKQDPKLQAKRNSERENPDLSSEDENFQPPKRRRIGEFPDDASNATETEGHLDRILQVDTASLQRELESLKEQGWNTVPSNWQVWEQDNGTLVAFEQVQKDGAILMAPIQNVDLKVIEFPDNPTLLWRSGKPVVPAEASRPFQRVKGLGNALSALSTMLKTRDVPAPSVNISEIKPGNVSVSASIPTVSSCCKFEELAEWWKAKATYANAQAPSTSSGSSSSKFSFTWPAESGHSKLSEFLSASKISKADFPKEFAPKDMELIATDNRARLLAQSAWQTSCSLDLLTNLLGSCSAESKKDKDFDCKLVVELAAKAVAGIASYLAPHTQSLVEEAIDKRLKLRANGISEKLKSVESKLLSAEPFAQKPCGSGVTFQEIANEAPKPAQVLLPPQVYKALTANQNSYGKSYNKGSGGGFFRKGTYNNQGKNKTGQKQFFRQQDTKAKPWNKGPYKSEKGNQGQNFSRKPNYNNDKKNETNYKRNDNNKYNKNNQSQ